MYIRQIVHIRKGNLAMNSCLTVKKIINRFKCKSSKLALIIVEIIVDRKNNDITKMRHPLILLKLLSPLTETLKCFFVIKQTKKFFEIRFCNIFNTKLYINDTNKIYFIVYFIVYFNFHFVYV